MRIMQVMLLSMQPLCHAICLAGDANHTQDDLSRHLCWFVGDQQLHVTLVIITCIYLNTHHHTISVFEDD